MNSSSTNSHPEKGDVNHWPGEKARSLNSFRRHVQGGTQECTVCVGSDGPRAWPCSGVPDQIRCHGHFAGTCFNIHALLHRCLHANKPLLPGWSPGTKVGAGLSPSPPPSRSGGCASGPLGRGDVVDGRQPVSARGLVQSNGRGLVQNNGWTPGRRGVGGLLCLSKGRCHRAAELVPRAVSARQ